MSSHRGRRASASRERKHHPEPSPYRHPGSSHTNVYNAVAGRVTARSACLEDTRPTADRPPRLQHQLTNNVALAPEEALFRPGTAPERYAERDIYMAHERDLSSPSVLPDSDLLKAVHLYSSHYYSAMRNMNSAAAAAAAGEPRVAGRGIDENSMDETALLAFGILLEEAGRGILGRRGDLVFTQGAGRDATGGGAPGDDAVPPPDLDTRSRRGSSVSVTNSVPSRRRKRRKMIDLDDD